MKKNARQNYPGKIICLFKFARVFFRFVAIDENDGNVKGVALNFDAFDEPEVKINPNNKLNVTFEFLEYLEKPLR